MSPARIAFRLRLSPATRTAAAGLLLAGGLALAGCGLFKPASPEIPTSAGILAKYTQPDTTLKTLALAVQDKAASNGQSAYIGGFASNFEVVFDPATLARYSSTGRTPETNWTADLEVTFYAKFSQLQPGTTYAMFWGTDSTAVDDERLPTSATLHRSYRVFALAENAEAPVTLARGNADLEFALIDGDWKIVRWTDREDPVAVIDRGEICFGQRRQESR